MATARDVRYRHATPDDLAAEHAVFCRAQASLFGATGYSWEAPPFERFVLGLKHLQAHDAERNWIAEIDGRVVGYAGALVRGGTWFLSMLFIDPAAQGRGIGRRLFELAGDGAPLRRLTITESIQPISNALYGRAGLLPVAPLIRFVGEVPSGGQPELEPGDPSPDDLARIDLAAYGFDRAIDHAFWGSRWTRHGWFSDGACVAWSYRWPDGTIGPLAAADPGAAAAALRSEMAAGGSVSVEMPATARPLMAAALAAGLRIKPPMGLLLSTDDVVAPTAIAISTYGFL